MKTPTRSLFLSLLGILLSLPALASLPDEAEGEAARHLFLAAEAALEAGDLSGYRQLIPALQHYPLLPYLEYQEFKQGLSAASAESVTSILERLAQTPLASQLKDDWLDLLAQQKRWWTYLAFSTPGGSSTRQCQRLQAMLATGNEEQAYPLVEPLWLSGRSRPKECDPIFEAWIDKGHLTEELVWQRIELAMLAGQTRLARYLKRFLPQAQGNWVEQWITLRRHPEKLLELRDKRHPRDLTLCTQITQRLALQDVEMAIETWRQLQKTVKFSDAQHLQIARTLASQLVRLDDNELAKQLIEVIPPHLRLDPGLSDRQFQAALHQNDWNRALVTIETLPQKSRLQQRWRYWQGRALLELGERTKAEKQLRPLARQRSYYGFMAAHQLGSEPQFEHQSLDAPLDEVERLAKLPGLRRARELMLLERPLAARREWNLALHDSGSETLKGAARLAQLWDWPSQAITTLSRLGYWNDLELRFPLNHLEQVDRQSRDHEIDKAWIYAILRQESAFVSDARSSAGALGLMQLMPTTAKEVASRTNLGRVTREDLLQPKINIELGTSYLSEMYRRLQENPVLATAAYNAGPHRVAKWLPTATQAADVWIETVPFMETREYLKRVLAYTLIYAHRLGESHERLPEAWMKPVQASPPEQAAKEKRGSDV